MSGSIPLLPLYAIMACRRKTLLFSIKAFYNISVKLLRASLNKQQTLVSAQHFDISRTVHKAVWQQNRTDLTSGVSTGDGGS